MARLLTLLALLLPASMGLSQDPVDLQAGFARPPGEARAWCYWWWLNGAASKEGITRDLVFKGNTIEDTQRDGRVSQRNGIFLGAGVDGVRTRGNIIQGQSGQAMVDRSGNAGNSLQ